MEKETTEYKKELDRMMTMVSAACALGVVLFTSALVDILGRKR